MQDMHLQWLGNHGFFREDDIILWTLDGTRRAATVDFMSSKWVLLLPGESEPVESFQRWAATMGSQGQGAYAQKAGLGC